MVSVTNNGWSKDPPITRIYVTGDPNGCEFRAGDVAALFGFFFEDFNREAEAIYMLNGYRSAAFNASVGGVASSNHVSGTAGDVNGDRHPNELVNKAKPYRSGFNAEQTARIRALIGGKYRGLIKWGMDFPVGARDAMHFEVRGTAAQVHDLVVALTPAPKPPTPTPTPPALDETLEAVMPYPRFYKMKGTNLAYEDLGDKRKRSSRDQFNRTMAQYPKGEPAIKELEVSDSFFNLDIVGDDSYGEGYVLAGHPEVWVDAAENGYHGRRYVSLETYTKRGGTTGVPLTTLPVTHEFWRLPIIGPSPS